MPTLIKAMQPTKNENEELDKGYAGLHNDPANLVLKKTSTQNREIEQLKLNLKPREDEREQLKF